MSASVAAGEQAKALAAYEALRQRLGRELGADPAPQTRELHLAILREQDDGLGTTQRRAAADAVRRGPAPGGTAPSGSVLPGRDREMGVLREAWNTAIGGSQGWSRSSARRGSGRPRWQSSSPPRRPKMAATVLRTRCYETERSLFLQPIVEAIAPVVASASAGTLRRLLGEHAAAAAGLLPEVAAILGPPPPGRGSMEMERRRAFEAVRAFLRGLAERNPVLVLVDDLQYAGQSTVELMHFLGREPPGARLLVVATVRAENDAQIGAALAPVARRVEVGPLSPEAVGQLARAAGQGELADRILERTRGHTLFVVEVLRALTSGDAGVPESLRTAVQARVRRAGPPVEALLRAAAVLGATVDPLTLGVMLDLVPATALELCEAALEARLLVVSGRDYEFANDLIREVLYASTPEPTRLAHHRRAADLLTGQPESLARHAAAAGDWLRAARAWLRAGEDAMGRYAASDAAALATQALEAGERVADAEVSARALVLRGRAHQAIGRRCRRAGRPDPGRRPRPHGRRPAARDARPVRTRQRRPGLSAACPSATTCPIWRTDCGSPSRSGTGPARRTCSPGSPSSRPTGCTSMWRSTTACGRWRPDARPRDDHALAAGLDGLKIAYLSLGDTGPWLACSPSWSRCCAAWVICSCCSGRSSKARSWPSPRRTGMRLRRHRDGHRDRTTGRLSALRRMVLGASGLAGTAARP